MSGALQEAIFLPEAGPYLDLLQAISQLIMAIAAMDQLEQEALEAVDTAPGEEPDQKRQTMERRFG